MFGTNILPDKEFDRFSSRNVMREKIFLSKQSGPMSSVWYKIQPSTQGGKYYEWNEFYNFKSRYKLKLSMCYISTKRDNEIRWRYFIIDPLRKIFKMDWRWLIHSTLWSAPIWKSNPAYESFTIGQRRKLYEFYQTDFHIFGYGWDIHTLELTVWNCIMPPNLNHSK